MFLRGGLLLKSAVPATVPIILTSISPGLMQDYARCKLCNSFGVIVTVK